MQKTKSSGILSGSKLFASHAMDSRIKSANVQNSERWIGYFLGPGGVILLNAIMASFLNVYWTDVAKINGLWGGAFILIFPILSKIFDAITNVIMGQIIDKTKARPWLLFAGPIIAIAAVLSFAIPQASPTVQACWIMFSYNLYYSIGYTIYYMSHTMLVPLSTRNAKQRDGVAMLSNMAMPGGAGVQDTQIVEAVQNGQLDEEVLNEAVRNVLTFVNRWQENRKADTVIDREANAKRSGEFAAKCAVLLKNDNAVLPLRKDAKVAFLGEFAAAPRYQGAGSSHINVSHAVSAVEAAGASVCYAQGYDLHKEVTDEALLAEAVVLAKSSQVAVVFAGLPDSFETEGCDRDTLAILNIPQMLFLCAVCGIEEWHLLRSTAVLRNPGLQKRYLCRSICYTHFSKKQPARFFLNLGLDMYLQVCHNYRPLFKYGIER